jgi:BatD DUF11 like domain
VKCPGHIFLLLLAPLFFLCAAAQVRFRTVVPQHPIAPGESFQVQYILEDADQVSDFSPPQFQGFRVVAGPSIYADTKSSLHRNLVFTLAAIREGRYKISGATCSVHGKFFKSNDAYVKITSVEAPEESPYFLRVGEDPFKKITANLLLKLVLDKQTCFVGEPLVATFKLYSRLQSRSNVIKNPGFYGFSIYDMVNVNDQVQSEENLNGRWFQVHIVRKVQLYPLQAGLFTIDPMELANEIEFSRSVVSKKTEQGVTEIMYGGKEDNKDRAANAEVYKMNLKTDPVVIKVKPLPSRNQADTFAGAVGNFSISAFLDRDSLTKNAENSLTIVIKGSGNFQRVDAPIIKWPQEFETFDPATSDTLNKQSIPLTGKRTFKYIFLTNQPGWHTIPAIPFSFFDLKTRSHKTVTTKPLTMFVSSRTASKKSTVAHRVVESTPVEWWRWLAPASLVLLMGGLLIWFKRKSTVTGKVEMANTPGQSDSVSGIAKILSPPKTALETSGENFYELLHQAIWAYLNVKLQLYGSEVSKEHLFTILALKKIDPHLINGLLQIIHHSEMGIYTNAEMHLDKNEQLKKTEEILTALDTSLR